MHSGCLIGLMLHYYNEGGGDVNLHWLKVTVTWVHVCFYLIHVLLADKLGEERMACMQVSVCVCRVFYPVVWLLLVPLLYFCLFSTSPVL